jgi:homocitrate synthase
MHRQEQEHILTNFKGVVDSTLREGLQFRHTAFSLEEQKQVLSYLHQVGVQRAEVGNPASPTQFDTIQSLVAEKERPLLIAHIRNTVSDLALALASGVEGINVLCTVDPERLACMGKTLDEYVSVLSEVISIAIKEGLEVKVGVEDFFGQNQADGLRILQTADRLGVDRVSIADTLGTAFPWQVESQVRWLREQVVADILVHLHNDLGMAQSNAVVALLAGANYVDTTILGIGERTGITSLSTLLTSLYVLNKEQISNQYALSLLTVIDNWLARILEISIPFSAVTNTQTAFNHKAGIHIDAIKKHGPAKYEPFAPGVIGNQRVIETGTAISGRTTQEGAQQIYSIYGRV